MARRGFGGTALRAALGAVTGVAEGLQQRDVVAAEKQRMADVMKRQQGLDAENTAFRLAGLMADGFEQGPARNVSLVGPALDAASGNAAPGAVGMPMPPAAAQAAIASASASEARPPRTITVGGTTLTLPYTASERAERRADDLRKETKTDAEKKAADEEARLVKLITDAQKGGKKSAAALRLNYENPAAYKNYFDDPSGGLSAARQDKKAEELRTAKAWFNTPINDPKRLRDVRATFVRMRAANPNAPAGELILDLYNATKASADLNNVIAQAAQRSQSAQPDFLDAAIMGGVGRGAPAGPVSNEQRLWDQAVAMHGREKVVAEYGQRP
jgi:hypothetical protein